jgi:hypothetical protein
MANNKSVKESASPNSDRRAAGRQIYMAFTI